MRLASLVSAVVVAGVLSSASYAQEKYGYPEARLDLLRHSIKRLDDSVNTLQRSLRGEAGTALLNRNLEIMVQGVLEYKKFLGKNNGKSANEELNIARRRFLDKRILPNYDYSVEDMFANVRAGIVSLPYYPVSTDYVGKYPHLDTKTLQEWYEVVYEIGLIRKVLRAGQESEIDSPMENQSPRPGYNRPGQYPWGGNGNDHDWK